VKGGSVLTAYFEKESGAFGLLTEGSTVTTNAQYVLVGIRSRPQGEDTWSTSNLKIPQGEIALVLYREIGGRNELVQVFTASGDGKKITSAGRSSSRTTTDRRYADLRCASSSALMRSARARSSWMRASRAFHQA
jgi:hypothetical protein